MYEELIEAYKEKDRKLVHMQELYDRAKRTIEMSSEAANKPVRETGVFTTSHSFDRTSLSRDLGPLPTVPIFGIAQHGNGQPKAMNTRAARTVSTQMGENFKWPRQVDGEHCE